MAGLIAGTDPEGPYYWGDVGLRPADGRDGGDRPGAAARPSTLLGSAYRTTARNLCTWLGMINLHEMSRNNWLFFRVLVNLAFEQLGRKEFAPS